jgi:ABC-type transport system involved in multi-copper enzyme maturation permease subunit
VTTTTPAAPAAAAGPPEVASASPLTSFGRLMRAEWTKIRSVRSTIWSLVIFVVVTVGFTALITWLITANWSQARPEQRAATVGDPTATILGTGLGFGQLAICVLGVLVVSSEYSTGMIRASLLAVPRRAPMLAAKALVFSLLVLAAGEVVAFCSFFLGAAILHSHAPVSLSDPGVARAVAGAGLYLMVLGLFSMAIGTVMRHTAGAVTTTIGVVFVLPLIASFLPGSWGQHVHDYLPSQAGAMIAQARQGTNQVLTPWQGFGVFCAESAILLGVAFYLLRRRDA